MEAAFSEPTDEDYDALANMWLSARNVVADEYGYELDQSYEDLDYIQKVIDDELIDFDSEYAGQCLGLVLGRVLANNEEGLDWWAVEDQYGRDLVIRYNETTIQLSALTMIAKRLQDGIKPDVRHLYDGLISHLEEIKDRAD